MKDKALRQALEFLEQLGENHWGNRPDVIAAIEQALAQPDLEQPTRPTKLLGPNLEEVLNSAGFYKKREWVNLTDDEIKEIIGSWGDTPIKGYTRKLMDQIQDKLKEKNNG